MSSPAGRGAVYQFPTSKAGKAGDPAWFAKVRTTARTAEFGRKGGFADPEFAGIPVPAHIGNIPLHAVDASGQRLPGPPGVPQLETPVPGSKSVPPLETAGSTAPGGAELRSRIQAFAEAAAELGAARMKIVASMEGQLLDLAMEVAAAIIEREVEEDPELHAALAREALRSLGHHGEPALRASATAVNAIAGLTGEPIIEVDGLRVKVVADPSLEGLGCVAENEFARVDGRVTERLRSVRRAIEDERRRRNREESE